MAVNDRGHGNAASTGADEDSLKRETSDVYSEDMDLVAYYEEAAGRLVVDPQYVFRCVPPNVLVKSRLVKQTSQGRVRRGSGFTAQALRGWFHGALATTV
jgi:hypothetical protein